MGAVSALLYTARKNDVKCIVLDSPFSDFPMLMEDYLNKYKVSGETRAVEGLFMLIVDSEDGRRLYFKKTAG